MAEAFFSEHNPLVWSGEENTIEEWTYSDGLLALTIGLGVCVAAVAGAALIAAFFTLGQLTR